MDIEAEYNKLTGNHLRDIDENIEDAVGAIEAMRGCNDRTVTPVHIWLDDVLTELITLQEASWKA